MLIELQEFNNSAVARDQKLDQMIANQTQMSDTMKQWVSTMDKENKSIDALTIALNAV